MQTPWITAIVLTTLTACGVPESIDENTGEPMSGPAAASEALSQTRTMLYEGTCHWLACCAKRNCGLSNSEVKGACGLSCSDTEAWFARPGGDVGAFPCGTCFQICGNGHCVVAKVWDTSDTSSDIEGNDAVFNALKLPHSADPSTCSGTGEATITIKGPVSC